MMHQTSRTSHCRKIISAPSLSIKFSKIWTPFSFDELYENFVVHLVEKVFKWLAFGDDQRRDFEFTLGFQKGPTEIEIRKGMRALVR